MKKLGVLTVAAFALAANTAMASGPGSAVSDGQVEPQEDARAVPPVATGSLGGGSTLPLILGAAALAAAIAAGDDDDSSSTTTTILN